MGGLTSGMSKNADYTCWRGTTREEDGSIAKQGQTILKLLHALMVVEKILGTTVS